MSTGWRTMRVVTASGTSTAVEPWAMSAVTVQVPSIDRFVPVAENEPSASSCRSRRELPTSGHASRQVAEMVQGTQPGQYDHEPAFDDDQPAERRREEGVDRPDLGDGAQDPGDDDDPDRHGGDLRELAGDGNGRFVCRPV